MANYDPSPRVFSMSLRAHSCKLLESYAVDIEHDFGDISPALSRLLSRQIEAQPAQRRGKVGEEIAKTDLRGS